MTTTLPLQGSSVEQFSISRALIIIALRQETSHATISIDVPFEMRNPLSGITSISTSNPSSLVHMLELLEASVISAVTHANGALQIEFSGGRTIVVSPDHQFEAWEFAASNGHRIVCIRGGELVVWPPD